MKCPDCSRNQKYSDGMKCGKCGYRFAINPKRSDGLTDNKLKVLAQKVSENGKYVFTRNQLYAAWVRQKSGVGSKIVGIIVSLVMIGVGVALVVAIEDDPFFGYFFMGFGALAFLLTLATSNVPNRKRFDRALNGYYSKGRALDNMIEKPSLHQAPPDWPEADIYDYGAESLVIVDKDLTVDLLVKNGFHAENRCVVISASGYPAYVTERARSMLAERPDLPVYLLHDAEKTPFAERLKRNAPVPLDWDNVTDLGLTLDQARSLPFSKKMAERGAVPIDHFAYGLIAAGLAMAILSGVPLDEAMARQGAGGDGGGGDSGGYG